MSWILDRYEKLKALWKRFLRWERQHIGYQEEWCFGVIGTAAEFEQRFRFMLPTISKSEFFREVYDWYNYETLSYFDDGEIGVKVPNRFPFILMAVFSWFAGSSLYYFHGNLEQYTGKLVLRGDYQPLYKFLNGPINFFTVCLVAGVIMTASGVIIGLGVFVSHAPVIEYVDAIALIFFGPIFAAFGFILRYASGAFFWAYDRGAAREIQRTLMEICGAPMEEAVG